jgi:hypothetical protein
MTTVLPATSAPALMPVRSATGKLNGPMTPNTPNGSRTLRLRSPGESVPSGTSNPPCSQSARTRSRSGRRPPRPRRSTRPGACRSRASRPPPTEHALADGAGGRAHEPAAIGDGHRAPVALRRGRGGQGLVHESVGRLAGAARDLALAARVPRANAAPSVRSAPPTTWGRGSCATSRGAWRQRSNAASSSRVRVPLVYVSRVAMTPSTAWRWRESTRCRREPPAVCSRCSGASCGTSIAGGPKIGAPVPAGTPRPHLDADVPPRRL